MSERTNSIFRFATLSEALDIINQSDENCFYFVLDLEQYDKDEFCKIIGTKKKVIAFCMSENFEKHLYRVAICTAFCNNIEFISCNKDDLLQIVNFLNNSIAKKRYVCINENKLKNYLNTYYLLGRLESEEKLVSCYKDKYNKIIVERYKNGLVILKVAEPINFDWLVDVTENELYLDENIGNVIFSNAIIEGAKGVGKTATITKLIETGIVCEDTSETICKYMFLADITTERRCKEYKKYLNQIAPKFVIFLVNDSKEELEKRTGSSDDCNTLYEKTYNNMQDYNITDSIKILNCTGLSLGEQVNSVRDCILRRSENKVL